MKRIIILYLLVVAHSGQAYSQIISNRTIDSLRQIIDQKKNDIDKVQLLAQYSYHVVFTAPEVLCDQCKINVCVDVFERVGITSRCSFGHPVAVVPVAHLHPGRDFIPGGGDLQCKIIVLQRFELRIHHFQLIGQGFFKMDAVPDDPSGRSGPTPRASAGSGPA